MAKAKETRQASPWQCAGGSRGQAGPRFQGCGSYAPERGLKEGRFTTPLQTDSREIWTSTQVRLKHTPRTKSEAISLRDGWFFTRRGAEQNADISFPLQQSESMKRQKKRFAWAEARECEMRKMSC
ncbi:hypothetical protein JRQ81_020040 [Phrynocephalus forsythii]|uniref:Uncharacterized protein n=1 Tax=Phrynocephalus forsythii TaxID=171643 RepID=A0A9Q1AYJ2_9SAUR|nr:hypothetical protein JRQ81_020040 [Phrynocephalus forsythii]